MGVFGYGVEGRATVRRLSSLTDDLVLVDDHPVDEGVLPTGGGGFEALATCEVVLKSPGIPRRREDVLALEDRGVTVTSALNLWLHDIDRSRVIAVTGTKGKSTTTSLVAFFLRCVGAEAHELGNIGTPPYDPDVDVTSGWLVLDISSFQSVDVTVAPAFVVVTSLGADHLDWHGSLERYHEDKLAITRASGEHQTLVADTPELAHALSRMGGRLSLVPADTTGLARRLGLLGAHNDHNVAVALEVVARATGRDVAGVRDAVDSRAGDFEPLRGRLTLVATHRVDGGAVRFVDDGLATGPLPTLAALEVFKDEEVALIAGGYDRGVDYEELVEALESREHVTTLVVIGPAGERIASLCRRVPTRHAATMSAAVRTANDCLPRGGVVLFSPAAPSFDAYKNWAERSDDFTSAARSLS